MAPPFISAIRHGEYIFALTGADCRLAAAGVEKYLAEERDLLDRRGISILGAFPFPTRRSRRLHRLLARYVGLLVDGVPCGFYAVRKLGDVAGLLNAAGKRLLEIQIHHLRHLDLAAVRDFLAAVPVPVRLFLHDFYTICPQYNLLRNDQMYCGSVPPSAEKCAGCRHWTPDHLSRIRDLLASLGDRLAVVAPSASAREIWIESFPEFSGRTAVVPHWRPEGRRHRAVRPNNPAAPLRLAYVGAPRAHKGWEAFTQAASELSAVGAPYEFFHLGLGAGAPANVRNIPVSFLRDGPQAMTNALRAAEIDVVLFWALWPETYSYVLHESWLAEVMVVASAASGHIARTVQAEALGPVLADLPALLAYLGDEKGVRRDLEQFRLRRAVLPERFVPNERIADELAALPRIEWSGPAGGVPRVWPVEWLYRLKLWKRRWADGGPGWPRRRERVQGSAAESPR